MAAYLACNLDVRATAEAMFLHPNSVRYRLRRVEELLGGAPITSAVIVANLYLRSTTSSRSRLPCRHAKPDHHKVYKRYRDLCPDAPHSGGDHAHGSRPPGAGGVLHRRPDSRQGGHHRGLLHARRAPVLAVRPLVAGHGLGSPVLSHVLAVHRGGLGGRRRYAGHPRGHGPVDGHLRGGQLRAVPVRRPHGPHRRPALPSAVRRARLGARTADLRGHRRLLRRLRGVRHRGRPAAVLRRRDQALVSRRGALRPAAGDRRSPGLARQAQRGTAPAVRGRAGRCGRHDHRQAGLPGRLAALGSGRR
ncbi:helix-turn-helix domain-containing protein [Streptomyces violaceusniger]|uniref:helix-turn-helix domain-containing protein n=1 Tax=Streptomyces violaceusniger TaxID=68280 RepID=UPI0038282DEB